MMTKVNIGIIGAAGYTAGELIRILLVHPNVNISFIQSESQSGKPIYSVHTDLAGESDLEFERSPDFTNADHIFLCKGHGESEKILTTYPELLNKKIIDLSQDYRIGERDGFIYGLAEINRESIKKADRIANPGCFATAIQLGLLPAIERGIVSSDIHISGITGSTGAGQSLSSTSHFSWRSGNTSVYKPFTHQHLKEVGQSIVQVDPQFQRQLNFIPYRGNFTRGIIITSYFESTIDEKDLGKIYKEFYGDHPFTKVVDTNPDLKMVVNTNKCLVYPAKIDDKVMVISVIDNLLKGASGQAVQNMNLMIGVEEQTSLRLKATAF